MFFSGFSVQSEATLRETFLSFASYRREDSLGKYELVINFALDKSLPLGNWGNRLLRGFFTPCFPLSDASWHDSRYSLPPPGFFFFFSALSLGSMSHLV